MYHTIFTNILQFIRGDDTKNGESRLQDISIHRHQTDAVRFFIAADNLIFLVIAVELLRQFKQVGANMMRLQTLSSAVNRPRIFTQFPDP